MTPIALVLHVLLTVAWAQAPQSRAAEPTPTEARTRVSVVMGCVDVEPGVHSYLTGSHVDSFAGFLARSEDGKKIALWVSGAVDFDRFLRDLRPGSPPGHSDERRGGVAIWQAEGRDSTFLVARGGHTLLLVYANDERQAAEARRIAESLIESTEGCSGAEQPVAVPVGLVPYAFVSSPGRRIVPGP